MMIRRSFLTFAAATLALSACANVGDAPEAETTPVERVETPEESTFTGTALPLNPSNSTIEWTAAKITRTHEGGFGAFSGSLYLDGEMVSGVELIIDATSIFTDTDRLTGHLKSEDFFEVAVYPEARFVATSYEPIADGTDATGATHTATGTLTIRDQSNQIVFPVTIEVTAETVSATADFIIDRQLWDLSFPGQPDDLIQDEVRIKLAVGADRNPETASEEVVLAD